jgi:hypothetical protein
MVGCPTEKACIGSFFHAVTKEEHPLSTNEVTAMADVLRGWRMLRPFHWRLGTVKNLGIVVQRQLIND